MIYRSRVEIKFFVGSGTASDPPRHKFFSYAIPIDDSSGFVNRGQIEKYISLSIFNATYKFQGDLRTSQLLQNRTFPLSTLGRLAYLISEDKAKYTCIRIHNSTENRYIILTLSVIYKIEGIRPILIMRF